MITRLELRNWRTYDRLQLPLGSGATFIVAPNGVGKSSIIEAARFAMFGSVPTREGVHKLGASDPTSAAVTIVLADDRTLEITRRLPIKKKAAPIVDATVDGLPIDPTALDGFLTGTFGASVAFLDRMSMMSGSEVIGSAVGLDLRSHLSAFLGLGGVEQALADTVRLLKAAEAEVQRHRNAASVSAVDLAELRLASERAQADLVEAEAHVVSAREQVKQARTDRYSAERVAEAVDRANARRTALAGLAAEAAKLVGTSVPADALDDALALTEAALNDEIERTRRRRAELAGRIAATSSSLEELTGAAGACPVCRRPLDPADIQTAREGHEAEIVAWQAERDGLDESDEAARLQQVGALRAAVIRQGAPPEPPTEAPTLGDASDAETAADGRLDAAAMAAAETRAAARAAKNSLGEAESAASALDAVTAAFEREATLQATKTALTEARAAVLTEGVEPLEEALRERWANLFDHRTGLTLDGAGTVARTIGDATLTFDRFSDGERMAAQLLLRVLVLKASTKLPFLWIDEPLEHLDPDARRALSLLLVSAPQEPGGPLRQVVMTTYEEPLVRRLQRSLVGTHVKYVRASDS